MKSILFQGNFEKLSSFTIINRRLVAGLRESGYKVEVFPTDSYQKSRVSRIFPDVYIFHGYPYDYKSAPGRFNIFILGYEYSSIKKEDKILITRLNNYFDLVCVPSTFVKQVLIKNGLRIPIEILPWGVDKEEFNPLVKPARLPTSKSFIFINAGGANERKGTDILLKAYTEEFSSEDDVSLVIKAFGYDHLKPWMKNVMNQTIMNRANAPEVIYIHKDDKNIAGYLAASNAGVFPYRGEGFGLPILECIASGKPVIVTQGTGPMDFCTTKNAKFIPAKNTIYKNREQLLPSLKELKSLMRDSFEKGPLGDKESNRISNGINKFNWNNTIALFGSLIRKHYKNRAKPNIKIITKRFSPVVGFSYFQKGGTSWKKVCNKIDYALKKNFTDYFPLDFSGKLKSNKFDFIVGQCQYCLEQFIRTAELNPKVVKLMVIATHTESEINATNRERMACGLEAINNHPMERFRYKAERLLSDYLIVASKMCKSDLMASGFPQERIRILPYGIDVHKPLAARKSDKINFFFVGTDPFRKGIRILFEAWDQLKLKNAKLTCVTTPDIFRSRLLTKYVIRNPNITIKNLLTQNRFSYRRCVEEYQSIDCQILPSLHDGFSFVVAEGMGVGKPAIVSDQTGIKDLLTHLHDGYIVKSGSADELKNGILYFYENKNKIKKMGLAAFETARKYSWESYEKELVELINLLYSKKS